MSPELTAVAFFKNINFLLYCKSLLLCLQCAATCGAAVAQTPTLATVSSSNSKCWEAACHAHARLSRSRCSPTSPMTTSWRSEEYPIRDLKYSYSQCYMYSIASICDRTDGSECCRVVSDLLPNFWCGLKCCHVLPFCRCCLGTVAIQKVLSLLPFCRCCL